MKYNLTNLLIVLACLIKSLTAFYVPYDNGKLKINWNLDHHKYMISDSC